jgi:hypothetical protein
VGLEEEGGGLQRGWGRRGGGGLNGTRGRGTGGGGLQRDWGGGWGVLRSGQGEGVFSGAEEKWRGGSSVGLKTSGGDG